MSTDQNEELDLAKRISMDNRSTGFINAVRSLAAIHQLFGDVLSTMSKAEQRILCQVAAWRLEGAPMLPATASLVHMPLLVGMGLDQIQQVIETLCDNEVLQKIIVATDKKGEVSEMAFRWAALDRLLLQGEQIAKGPRLVGLSGAPLTGA